MHSDKSLLSADELRRHAEERLQERTAKRHSPRTDEETQRLIHELEVHQIELEMQNEELRQARDEVERTLELNGKKGEAEALARRTVGEAEALARQTIGEAEPLALQLVEDAVAEALLKTEEAPCVRIDVASLPKFCVNLRGKRERPNVHQISRRV